MIHQPQNDSCLFGIYGNLNTVFCLDALQSHMPFHSRFKQLFNPSEGLQMSSRKCIPATYKIPLRSWQCTPLALIDNSIPGPQGISIVVKKNFAGNPRGCSLLTGVIISLHKAPTHPTSRRSRRAKKTREINYTTSQETRRMHVIYRNFDNLFAMSSADK